MRGQLVSDPRLADSGFAGQQEQASAAALGALEARAQLRHLALAADERASTDVALR